jgi:hypothetical protein
VFIDLSIVQYSEETTAFPKFGVFESSDAKLKGTSAQLGQLERGLRLNRSESFRLILDKFA